MQALQATDKYIFSHLNVKREFFKSRENRIFQKKELVGGKYAILRPYSYCAHFQRHTQQPHFISLEYREHLGGTIEAFGPNAHAKP